jgi:TRAP-type C4-dicarboxylate transport system substrate-binding protein
MRRALFVAALVAAVAAPVFGRAAVSIKLATQVPVNSSWHKALLDMGADWTAKTGGRVELVVYAGGSQGSESATIKKMRPGVDQLQANLLMVAGLSEIDDAFGVFGMPFFFQTDEEAADVQQKLTPVIEKRLEAKGFHLLCWGSGGWVQIFSKKPIHNLDELKQAKLYTSEGDDKMVQWYKSNGFHPVALSSNDIPTQLKLANGMIDAAPTPPYPALVLQMFRDAKFMLDVRVAPLVGGLVMTDAAWNRIDAADRPAVEAAAKAFETRVNTDAPKQDADSLTTMKQRGLTVTVMDPKALAELRAAADKLVATMRGTMVPADIYDMALQERDAFRRTKAK